MDEKTKKIAIYAGLAVAVFVFVLLLRKRSGGTPYYTTGISGQEAAAISTAGIAASSQIQQAYYAEQLGIAQAADQLAYGKNTNATNLAIAKSGNSTLQAIEEKYIAAEQAVALNTNKTNADIVANMGSTAIGMQPSWLDRLLGITSFADQFGGNNYTGGSPQPFSSLTQMLGQIFGGMFGGGGGGGGISGGGGGGFGGFMIPSFGGGGGGGGSAPGGGVVSL